MKAHSILTLFLSISCACSIVLANGIPDQPNKCPDLTLIQQKKAFAGVVINNNFRVYAGATQISLYDTNAVWQLEVYDKYMMATSIQEATNKSQKILATTTGAPLAKYDAKINAWTCDYKTDSKMNIYVFAISPVPHNLHPEDAAA